MEIITVPFEVRLDRRTVEVSHVAAGLTVGLEPGEEVLVLDSAGEHHAATVGEIRFELEDTVYVLVVGARIPPELVEERLRGVASGSDEAGVHEVLDLLGELRAIVSDAQARDDDQDGNDGPGRGSRAEALLQLVG